VSEDDDGPWPPPALAGSGPMGWQPEGEMQEVRKTFHQELDEIRADTARLAGMVCEAINRGTQAMLDADLRTADDLIRGDDVLDSLALDIEERCYMVLALQQPVAADLRALITAIRMVAEIERSGDLVVNTMKALRRIYGSELTPRLRGLIERLGEQSHRLFRLSIDAYLDEDAGLASALDDMDDVVDELHADFIEAIFEAHSEGRKDLQSAVQLALVGRYYERIADHAVNIGERVSYMVTGWLPEHSGDGSG
jgi:phosphate transport system protein